MKNEPRIVVDANVLISGALSATGTARRSIIRAMRVGQVITSADTENEFITRLHLKKFDRYLSDDQREEYVARILTQVKRVRVTEDVAICRDPRR